MPPFGSCFRRFLNTLLLAVCSLGFAQVWAAESPSADSRLVQEAGPRIRFAETTIDFGRIESGAKVSHNFVFTNTGSQTLEIHDVRPSCGCTTSLNWARKVEPGDSGTIPFLFNSKDFSGEVLKTIIVVCNDSQNTNVVLQLKGYVSTSIEIVPTLALFTPSSDSATNQIRVLQITNHLEEPLMLFDPVSSNPVFETQLRTNRQGKEYELQVALKRPFVLTNTIASITLKTSSTKIPELTIPSHLMVPAAMSAIPDRISLPATAPASDSKFTVIVRSLGTNVLALSEATVNAEGASADIREVQPGRMFHVTLRFPAGFRVPPGQKVEARVKTNNPLFPELKIPVTQGQSLAATLNSSPEGERDQSRGFKN